MKTLTLIRDLKVAEYGVFGTIEAGELRFNTVEQPDRQNAANASCIPPGVYRVKMRPATKLLPLGIPECYEVLDVPGRFAILIHVANWPHDVQGCIGLGVARAFVDGKFMVTQSKVAILSFYHYMNGEEFELIIKEVP